MPMTLAYRAGWGLAAPSAADQAMAHMGCVRILASSPRGSACWTEGEHTNSNNRLRPQSLLIATSSCAELAL